MSQDEQDWEFWKDFQAWSFQLEKRMKITSWLIIGLAIWIGLFWVGSWRQSA